MSSVFICHNNLYWLAFLMDDLTYGEQVRRIIRDNEFTDNKKVNHASTIYSFGIDALPNFTEKQLDNFDKKDLCIFKYMKRYAIQDKITARGFLATNDKDSCALYRWFKEDVSKHSDFDQDVKLNHLKRYLNVLEAASYRMSFKFFANSVGLVIEGGDVENNQ